MAVVEVCDLAESCRGDVRYNHFGLTMLLLPAYLPTGQTALCL